MPQRPRTMLMLILAGCPRPDDTGGDPPPRDSPADSGAAFTTGAPPAGPGSCLLGDPPGEIAASGCTATLLRSEDPVEAELLGRYRSHVYRLDYAHEGQEHHGFFRLDLPCLPAGRPLPDHLGVLLLVEGGAGLSQGLGVRQDPRDEHEHEVASTLASGASATGAGRWYRPGPPMVVITPTQPGRGEEAEELLASGDLDIPRPGFPWHTPANETGQDYGGALTIAALEAVATSAGAALEQLRAEDPTGALQAADERWLVLSTSNALITAARWMATTAQPVHAIVDYEGSTDSLEQTKGAWSIDPFGISGLDLPAEPSLEAWSADFVAGIDTFTFRPPREILAQLPSQDSLFDGSPLARQHPEHWARWYGPEAYEPERLASEQATFWDEREAEVWLPTSAARGTVHLRMQSSQDHALPPWLMQRHAVRAMNASLSGGGLVFYTDRDGYEAARATGIEADPAAWTEAADIEDWHAWGEGWAEVPMDWTAKVDLLRWAAAWEVGG